jgi:hypothetical protein
MSDEAEWAKLAEAATPGPWTVEEATEAKRFYVDSMPLTADVNATGEPVAYGGPAEDGGPHVGACRVPDAAFIAAAREAVPALLAEVTRLRTETDELQENLNEDRMTVIKQRGALAAARVEVSQLRGAAEVAVRPIALRFGREYNADNPSAMAQDITEHLAALLAEPLGSTPDPPATEAKS